MTNKNFSTVSNVPAVDLDHLVTNVSAAIEKANIDSAKQRVSPKKSTFDELKKAFNAAATDYFRDETADHTAAYGKATNEFSVAIAFSVLKKCYNTSGNDFMRELMAALYRDNKTLCDYPAAAAYELTYNRDGGAKTTVADKAAKRGLDAQSATSLSDAYDLVSIASLSLMEQSIELFNRFNAVDVEQTFNKRVLSRHIYVRIDETADCYWKDVETNAVRETFKAVRRAVLNSGGAKTDPKNGYTYLSEIVTDNETGVDETIYHRLHKYADLGGQVGGLYSATEQTVIDTAAAVEKLKLSSREMTVLDLKMRGYGNKSITRYTGTSENSVKGCEKRIRQKAVKVGFTADSLEQARKRIASEQDSEKWLCYAMQIEQVGGVPLVSVHGGGVPENMFVLSRCATTSYFPAVDFVERDEHAEHAEQDEQAAAFESACKLFSVKYEQAAAAAAYEQAAAFNPLSVRDENAYIRNVAYKAAAAVAFPVKK